MIVHKVDNLQADVTIPLAEARVLHNALTAAMIHIGPGALMAGTIIVIDIEHMRGILKGIADS